MEDVNNIKKVSASGLEDYLYCSLLYKFKHQYKLPYMPGSVKEAFYIAYKSALLKFLHEVGLANKPLRKCIAEAQQLFVKKMRFALGSFDKLDMSGEDLVARGVLQLNESHSLIRPNKDVVAAIDLPVSVNFSGVEIDYTIDGIIVQNDGTASNRIRVVSVVDDFSDLALSAKHDQLQFGLMKQSLKEHFMTGKKNGGAFSQAQVEVIKVSGASTESSATHHTQSPAQHLDPLATTAIKGIEEGIFLPTGQAQKCKSCWFNDICSNNLCGPDLEPQKVEFLTKKLRTKQTKVAVKAAQSLDLNG